MTTDIYLKVKLVRESKNLWNRQKRIKKKNKFNTFVKLPSQIHRKTQYKAAAGFLDCWSQALWASTSRCRSPSYDRVSPAATQEHLL